MIEHPFLQFDDEGRLQSDLSCIGCGYNLRSMREGDHCPECGSLTMATFAQLPLWGVEAKLWTADPNWVQRLRIGYGRWCVCMLVGLFMFITLFLTANLMFFSGLPFVVHLLFVLIWCMPWLLMGWGLWQATVAPRHETQSLWWKLGRGICRICAVVRVVLWLLIGFNFLTDHAAFSDVLIMYTALAVFLVLLVELSAWWSLLLYLRPLVRTLLPNAMSLWYLTVFGGLVMILVWLINFGLLVYLERSPRYYFGPSAMAWMFPAWLSNVGPLVGILWLAWIYALTWMLWRTLRRFKIVST